MRSLPWLTLFSLLAACSSPPESSRERYLFTGNWKFHAGEVPGASLPGYDDSEWRVLDLPHDWSIEGEFSEENPCGIAGGALPTGIGWYRKTFPVGDTSPGRRWYIDFDGVYRNSEVWINGQYLGKRASGYSSFRYDLTPFLYSQGKENVLAVRVDNSLQPNSRWYTGSGIYRNVWMTGTRNIHVAHWGSYLRTPEIDEKRALVELDLEIRNHSGEPAVLSIETEIQDARGKAISKRKDPLEMEGSVARLTQTLEIPDPDLWSPDNPDLYRAVTRILRHGKEKDRYETPFGIRSFEFHPEKGFFLNGQYLKIKGVCRHHDLGALGAAIHSRAIERQLKILKAMGCNAIRTAHNPPAPELLDLCDRMGFLVMDEGFDVWERGKLRRDGHLDWEEWHVKDLGDLVRRDRNHPCVILWSIGNEIPEQFDSTGTRKARELAGIVKSFDSTRPVTCALTEQDPGLNYIYRSGALDVISFNYKHEGYMDFPELYPGEKLLAAENMSALATRGHYDMPSDSVRIWPSAYRAPILGANPDFTVSAYDNVHAYWGATHEETWDVVRNHDFISGMFIWSGFDYLGEPVPYSWPARSSYYGVIDLAGFPKDSYYLYQSEWTDRDVLHVFPHWNWEPGQVVDVWAYYNHADEAELFLNGESMGRRSKAQGKYHVRWRLVFGPGSIRVVTRVQGREVLEEEIRTAGQPAGIELVPDRTALGSRDLGFITVRIVDREGNLCPLADNLVRFSLRGNGKIAGVDNGYQASHEPFKANYRKAFNGLCLLIVETGTGKEDLEIEAISGNLSPATLRLSTNLAMRGEL